MAATLEHVAFAVAGGAAEYLETIGWELYEWQDYVLRLPGVPTMIVSTRQAGKTFAIAGKAFHTARKIKRSLSAVVCPDQDKSKTLVSRVAMIARNDESVGGFEPDNTEEKGLANGSIIRGLPGTVKGVVSHTAKLLVFDEAGLVPRDLYDAATPMQAAVDDPWTFAISSAWWKRGWFWEEWNEGTAWKKILVRAKWDIKDGRIVPAMPEEEYRAMWKERGVTAFYSPRPTKQFLEFELTQHPESTIRQQYFCEFQEIKGSVFTDAWITQAFTTDVKPLFGKSGDNLLDPKIKKLEV